MGASQRNNKILEIKWEGTGKFHGNQSLQFSLERKIQNFLSEVVPFNEKVAWICMHISSIGDHILLFTIPNSFNRVRFKCDPRALFATNTWVTRLSGNTPPLTAGKPPSISPWSANNLTETYPSEIIVCLDNLLSLAFFCDRFFDLRLVGSGAVVSIWTNVLTPKPLISSK